MATWTTAELAAIAASDELQLRSERADGTLRDPVTIWVVQDGEDLYVRPVNGRDGWYRGTQTTHQGQISSGGVDKHVRFADASDDPELNKAIDAAYRAKYHAYAASIVGPVTNDRARSATIQLIPR
jgi:hypothetical protein